MEKPDIVLAPADPLPATAAINAPIDAEETFGQSVLATAVSMSVIGTWAFIGLSAKAAIALVERTPTKVIDTISDIVLPCAGAAAAVLPIQQVCCNTGM